MSKQSKVLTVEFVENGFVVQENSGRHDGEGRRWVFETAQALSTFMQSWGEASFKDRDPAGDDGFIPWPGGDRPVSEAKVVALKYRSGSVSSGCRAEMLRWDHAGRPNDIMAYKVIR